MFTIFVTKKNVHEEPTILRFSKSKVTVGRSEDNDIVLPSGKVSRHHAMIQEKGDETFKVEDLNSADGTTVNGSTIDTYRTVDSSSYVVIGDFTLRVFPGQPDAGVLRPQMSAQKPLKPGRTLFALLSYFFTLGFAGLFAFIAWQLFHGRIIYEIAVFAASAIAFALTAMLFSYLNVRKTMGTPGELLLFSTWFPLGMSVVPVAGSLLALWGSFQLFRGLVHGAVITTSRGMRGGSLRSYEDQKIGSSALGGGFVLLLAALVMPVIFVPKTSIPAMIIEELGMEPILNSWDENNDLSCIVKKTYAAKNKTITGEIYASGECTILLNNCKVISERVHISGDARFEMQEGAVFDTIRFANDAQGLFHNVKFSGEDFSLYLGNRAHLDIVGGSVTAKEGQLLSANSSSTASIEGIKAKVDTGIYASGNAQVDVKDSEIEASNKVIYASQKSRVVFENVVALSPQEGGIYCSNNAHISLVKGSLKAQTAISPSGHCQVIYDETEIKGRIRRAKEHVTNKNAPIKATKTHKKKP